MSSLSLRIGELLVVQIEKLSFGGRGLARHTPAGSTTPVVIFVPFSAPGDHLKIKITQLKKRHAEGQTVEVLKPGPSRIDAPCVVYGQCGGCNLQHINYESQLEIKQSIVTEMLKPFLDADGMQMQTIVPSPAPWNYRQRSQLKFQQNKLGFFAPQSHELVNIDACLILQKSLSDQIPARRSELQNKHPNQLEPLTIEFNMGHSALPTDENQGFSQVNREQNENLIARLLEWARLTSDREHRLFDLYAGSGNFTFPLVNLKTHRQVVGVEGHSGACEAAQNQAKKIKLSPRVLEFYNSDVEVFLRRFSIEPEDEVLLDPPRIGCDERVIKSLAASRPRRIAYISCDPAALSRDLDRLLQFSEQKYVVNRVQCFDMFPQTHHIETLVELTRKLR